MGRPSTFSLILILIGAFLLRLALSPFGTLPLDMSTFIAWSQSLVQGGFNHFYEGWSDYLPGYLYVLWLLGKIHASFPTLPELTLYKLPAILADVTSGFLIFQIVSQFKKKLAWLAAIFYLFNPAVIANSTLWGQVDSLVIMFALLAIILAQRRIFLSVFVLSIGTLIKPQAAFIAPIILLIWWKKFDVKKVVVGIVTGLAIFILGFAPFSHDKNLFSFILERLTISASQYPYTSVNAFNFWGIGGFWQAEGWLGILGLGMTLGILGFLTIRRLSYKEKPSLIFLISSIYFLTSFLFLTRIHERHLLPVLAPLAIAAVEFPVLWVAYTLLSGTYLANLYFSFIWITQDFRVIFSATEIFLLVMLNMISLVLMVIVFLKPRLGRLPLLFVHQRKRLNAALSDTTFGLGFTRSAATLPARYERPILIAILIFALLSRIIDLNSPRTFYFDEVYHAFTARELLNGNTAAWEWWTTPPEGFAYEWTHPPLAKEGMMLGMKVLGENPIGWRWPGVLLGVGAVFLVYLLGKRIFKSNTVGILSATIFSLDGVPLVMSRIGMNDSYFLFFALCTILFFLKEKYFFASVSLGLAAASKWTALWLWPVLILAMFLFKIKPRRRILWFLIVPVIYLVSYIPFFTSGHTVSQFIELQQQMWWYHTGLRAQHDYQSAALSWPLMVRPVWLFVDHKDDLVANIYILGNPLIFWGGLVAMVIAGVVGLLRRQGNLLFVVGGWSIMFLPWAASPRVMFLYHYLPAIPFLSLAIGWWLSTQNKKTIAYCLLPIALSYLFFFPHWTGIFVPGWLDNLYYWLPSWR
ncbi:glycosyltransferase family 39 protein [Candidatus Microgenomates bacterium]|nr:glycosyltransferase family 39 protein [Candidatus Microgenomates bacterium]